MNIAVINMYSYVILVLNDDNDKNDWLLLRIWSLNAVNWTETNVYCCLPSVEKRGNA